MNEIDKNKIVKMAAIILLILVAVGIASQFHKKSSLTLDEYAKNHPKSGPSADVSANNADTNLSKGDVSGNTADVSTGALNTNDVSANDVIANDVIEGNLDKPAATLTGALLNGGADGQAMLAERITYRTAAGTIAEDFYYEPLSENLQRYITGVSYPAVNQEDVLAITYDELRYVHVLHYTFDGAAVEGELICNAAIADDFLDIFYELYRNEYQIEKIRLIDEYNGDDTTSMEDNNTSCFNYRVVEGSASLSKHAYGLAIDVNPFYNPYITYNGDGTEKVSPAAALPYADRNASFPYKIDENDLCYKLFVQHGFTWGGNWNSSKDYQHFQKVP